MTLKELKRMKKDIRRLRSKLNSLKARSTSMSVPLSGMPMTKGARDRIGEQVAEICETEKSLEELAADYKEQLNKLSSDICEESWIFLHVAYGYSWRKIALNVDGRQDTADSIRMRCYRYRW